MTTIAFIGLGVMGAPMAANLIGAGFDVVGVNRSPSRVAAHTARGGRAAGTVAEAVVDADVVITMVPDSPDVAQVMTGEDGVFANAKANALTIDMSTIKPEVSRELAMRARERGLRPLDAPVSGGEVAAIDGTLSIMVGGEPHDFAAAKPIFEAIGGTVVHVGPDGAGQTVKAANQLIVAGNIQLVSEAIVFLAAHGVDLDSAVAVLSNGLAGSTVLQRKAASMIGRHFTPGFRVDLHHKDLGIVLEAARAAGVAIPLGAAVAELMASLRAQGGGDLDHTALLLQVERLSGTIGELRAEMT
jgi:2-hydroxy-3-oxopropionate reductase